MNISEFCLFKQHLLHGNFRAAFMLTGIQWEYKSSEDTEEKCLNYSDSVFGIKIANFYAEQRNLFKENKYEAEFFAEAFRYLAEHKIRKALWNLVYKKKERETMSSLHHIDISHLSKEQIEKFKVDLIHLNKNAPVEVIACFIKGSHHEVI